MQGSIDDVLETWAEMKKKVDAAKADIIAGKIKVADYMADNACKY